MLETHQECLNILEYINISLNLGKIWGELKYMNIK